VTGITKVGAATDGVTLFFPLKKLTIFLVDHPLKNDYLFGYRLLTISTLSAFKCCATKNNFIRVSPRAVGLPPPLVTLLGLVQEYQYFGPG